MLRPLTANGRKQSLTAGVKLRELIGKESVRFFVSPFKTTRQSLCRSFLDIFERQF